MLSSDLSGLFTQQPQGMGVQNQIVQGVILSFSKVDGSNTVGVNGAVLTNVPMLATGAEIDYAAGNAILLIVLGNTYMILGRVAMVGSSTFASASSSFANASNGTTNFPLTTAFATITSCALTVPTWANTMLCIAYATFSGNPNAATTLQEYVTIRGGASSAQSIVTETNLTYWLSLNATLATTVSVTPGATINFDMELSSTIACPAATSFNGNIAVTAIFTKQ